MAIINNEATHKLLARAIGASLLAAFGIGMYQSMAMGGGALVAAANESPNALLQSLHIRVLANSAGAGLTIFTAVGFFLLLRPVNAALSLIASALRLVSAGLTAFGIYSANALVELISQAAGDEKLLASVEALNALNFDLFHWGLIASSFGATITFALLYVSRLVPRLLAGYGVLASLGVVIGASSIYLAPPLSQAMFPAYVAANALAYVSLMAWLLVAGVNAAHWNARSA